MSKAEDLSRQYVLPFLDKQYEKYGEHNQMELTRFDGYDIMSAYEEGYHQAEKDLDISWVKEVSGVKEMKRAEEEALKAYPPRSIAANYDTIARRDAFEFGYLKAEKDLELTWEDLKLLQDISNEVFAEVANGSVDYYQIYPTQQSFLEEVLKRFKERKENYSTKD